MNSNERKAWVMVLCFSATVIAVLTLYALHLHRQETGPLRKAVAATGSGTGPGQAAAPDWQDHHFDSSFSGAIDRLNHAFRNHPAMQVEDLIAKANAGTPKGQDQPCPITWHDNETTLAVRVDRIGKQSPTDLISNCAVAIEGLR